MLRPPVWWVVVLLVAVLAGCDDDVEPPVDEPGEVYLPSFDALEAGWNTLLPGAPAVCARGGEYAFFVWPGARDRVLINFAGGGACWKESNCQPGRSIFPESLTTNRAAIASGASFPGLFDMDDAANPYADWTQVVVAYCTGDHHLGDVTASYGSGGDAFTVEHKGAVNADAVLDWTERELGEATEVVVAGCSGGGYGAALWLEDIAARFPAAELGLYVDSAIGTLVPEVLERQGDAWDAWARFPADVPGLDPDTVAHGSLDQESILIALADHRPELDIAVVNSAQDRAQSALYVENDGAGDWATLARETTERLTNAAPNLTAVLVPGDVHCLLFDAAFYATMIDGQTLPEWLVARLE